MNKTRKEKLRYVFLWIGYVTIGAYALSYTLTYSFALISGMQYPLIGINSIGEIAVELPVYLGTLPCVVYAVFDIRKRLLVNRVVFRRSEDVLLSSLEGTA